MFLMQILQNFDLINLTFICYVHFCKKMGLKREQDWLDPSKVIMVIIVIVVRNKIICNYCCYGCYGYHGQFAYCGYYKICLNVVRAHTSA